MQSVMNKNQHPWNQHKEASPAGIARLYEGMDTPPEEIERRTHRKAGVVRKLGRVGFGLGLAAASVTAGLHYRAEHDVPDYTKELQEQVGEMHTVGPEENPQNIAAHLVDAEGKPLEGGARQHAENLIASQADKNAGLQQSQGVELPEGTHFVGDGNS